MLVPLGAGANGLAVIGMSDNGKGIPPKLRRKVFGRFVRLGSQSAGRRCENQRSCADHSVGGVADVPSNHLINRPMCEFAAI